MKILWAMAQTLLLLSLTQRALGADLEEDLCKAFVAGQAQGIRDASAWTAMENTSENDFAKDLARKKLHLIVQADLNHRDYAVYALTQQIVRRRLPLRLMLNTLSTMQEDFGDGAKDYVSVIGSLPCFPSVTVHLDDFAPSGSAIEVISSLKVGQTLRVLGSFDAHDPDYNSPAAAIEWGGIPWGPFGGFHASYLTSPELEMRPVSIDGAPVVGRTP